MLKTHGVTLLSLSHFFFSKFRMLFFYRLDIKLNNMKIHWIWTTSLCFGILVIEMA
jgi:hypothetical protein